MALARFAVHNQIDVDTVNDMFALPGLTDGQTVSTHRYSANHTVGDGSGNQYVYQAGNSDTPDGGFTMPGLGGSLSFTGSGGTFDGVSGTGRFVALNQDVSSVAKFGADGTATNDTSAMRQAIISEKLIEVNRDITIETALTHTGPLSSLGLCSLRTQV